MKPAAFHYLRPKTITDAIECLRREDGETRILAGGQSLVPMLNFRLARFDYLIDINYIDELAYIRREENFLRIGAMTRQRAIETSTLVASATPLLQKVTCSIGHLPTRSRGTIGGSVAHADPAAEYPATLIALGATMVAQSEAGKRDIAADDFFEDIYSTALRPDELLVEIKVPVVRPGQLFGFDEISRRKGDLAIIGIVGAFSIDGDRIATARLVAFGLASAPQRIREAEEILQNCAVNQAPLDDVARIVTSNVNSHDDVAATANLRSHLAGVLARNVAENALRSRS
jgi:CO/xanthine dehydrogenase FAD-binding subunit